MGFYEVLGHGLDYIDMELINKVGGDEFDAWINASASVNSESTKASELASLYSFMLYFEIPAEEIRDYLVRQREAAIEHGFDEYMTDEDIDVLLSRDDKAVAERFAKASVIAVGGNVYSPKWIYTHSPEDYTAAGISRIQVADRIKYYKEFNLSPEARKYFRTKLSLYLDRRIDFEKSPEPVTAESTPEEIEAEIALNDKRHNENQKFIRTEKICGICIGTPAEEVEEILGKPLKINEYKDTPDGFIEEWCYTDGPGYPFLVFDVFNDGEKTVRYINLGDMSVTDSGIKIGSTRQEVIEAYKNNNLTVYLTYVPYEDWESVSLYGDYPLVIGHWKSGGMEFFFENDILTYICLRSGTSV